jgi:hypothetical protein
MPAYDIKNNPINPSDYEEKLAGSIARVCFSIVHFYIRERHIFNAQLRDVTIVRPPSSITKKSLQHILHPKKKQRIA